MGQARKIALAMVIGAREETRQIASTLIEESGFQVLEASDIEEAAALVMRHARKLCFIFADAASPQEARALALLISENWPWIRVLISMDRAVLDAVELPAGAARMRRPWRPLDLLIEAERAMH